jgi:hypothetical protein
MTYWKLEKNVSGEETEGKTWAGEEGGEGEGGDVRKAGGLKERYRRAGRFMRH